MRGPREAARSGQKENPAVLPGRGSASTVGSVHGIAPGARRVTNSSELMTPEALLTTARTVRKRLDPTRPVPLDLVRAGLTVALQAPSGSDPDTLRRRTRTRWAGAAPPCCRASLRIRTGSAPYPTRFWCGCPPCAARPARRSPHGNERTGRPAPQTLPEPERKSHSLDRPQLCRKRPMVASLIVEGPDQQYPRRR